MQLKYLRYKTLYIVPRDNYAELVLVSSLKLSTLLDCMFGFFGSAGLKSRAPGLAEYLVRTTEPTRLGALRDGIYMPSIVLET